MANPTPRTNDNDGQGRPYPGVDLPGGALRETSADRGLLLQALRGLYLGGTASNRGIAENYSDQQTLYRALARQLEGDAAKYHDVRNAVLDNFIRYYLDQEHPLHGTYKQLDTTFVKGLSESMPFIGALSYPDACSPNESTEVLNFIADALDIHICVFQRPTGSRKATVPVSHHGQQSYPIANVCQTVDTGSTTVRYDSLTEDDTGHALIKFMKEKIEKYRTKEGVPQISEVRWKFEGTADNITVHHYNGKEGALPNLSGEIRSLCVFNVSVSNPNQMREAVALLDEVLQRAPAQERFHLGQDGARGTLHRYVGVDLEFCYAKDRLDDNDEHAQRIAGLDSDEGAERLCSVLSLAVDRHVVFTIYLRHMLNEPGREVLDAIEYLLKHVIFRPDLIKLWFNYQGDLKALDATLAHMYRARADVSGAFVPIKRTIVTRDESDRWKWSDPVFQGERPENLYMPGEMKSDCPFHKPHDPKVPHDPKAPRIFSCICDRGNVDITTVIDHICRDLGVKSLKDGTEETDRQNDMSKRYWFDSRHRCNYGACLQWILGHNRLYPLLHYFKESRWRYPIERYDLFYEDMNPEMEEQEDMCLLGYTMGDVIGIALFMRFLTTTDDRHLLARSLLDYVHQTTIGARPVNEARLQAPEVGSYGIPSIVDWPRLPDGDAGRNWREWEYRELEEFRRHGNPGSVLPLSYAEHEERARSVQWAYGNVKSYYVDKIRDAEHKRRDRDDKVKDAQRSRNAHRSQVAQERDVEDAYEKLAKATQDLNQIQRESANPSVVQLRAATRSIVENRYKRDFRLRRKPVIRPAASHNLSLLDKVTKLRRNRLGFPRGFLFEWSSASINRVLAYGSSIRGITEAYEDGTMEELKTFAWAVTNYERGQLTLEAEPWRQVDAPIPVWDPRLVNDVYVNSGRIYRDDCEEVDAVLGKDYWRLTIDPNEPLTEAPQPVVVTDNMVQW